MITDSQGENTKKHALPIFILVALLFTMACTFYNDGFNLGVEPDVATYKAHLATRDIESLPSGNTPKPIEEPVTASEPDDLSAPLSPAENSTLTDNIVEYSVAATNQGCTCSVDGNNIMRLLDVKDDILIYKKA